MLTYSCLYHSKEAFQTFLFENSIASARDCLVRIYTAICTPEEAVSIAGEIRQLLPQAQIFGSSGSGVIYHGDQYDQETLVVLELLEQTETVVQAFTFRGKSPAEMAQEICDSIRPGGAELMHAVCGEHYPDVSRFVEEFNRRRGSVRLVGGIAGDVLPRNHMGYVFTEDGLVEQGILTLSYYNKSLHVYNAVNIAHEPISPLYQLNRTEDGRLLEIEGRPGVDWCTEQLGVKALTVYDDWQMIAENDALLRFPLVLEGHGGASRFLRFDADAKQMAIYFSKLSDQTPFRIGYVSPIRCVSESYAICNEIEQHPVESLFCYTCLFRKLYLQNCAEWELRPFREAEVCGVFMMGEIALINGVNEFLNGSCCLSAIAEGERRISPDYSVFADLGQIQDETESLLHFVLKKQSEAMSRENSTLLAKLMQQQSLMQDRLYTDLNTGISNSIRFLQEEQERGFDKLCMVVIDNAELLLSRMGKERYLHLFKEVCQEVARCCREVYEGEGLEFYIQNDSSLFLAANGQLSEERFMTLVKQLYHQLQYRKLESKRELLVNRFVVVVSQGQLLEKAFSTLKNGSHLQTDFLVWDSSMDVEDPLEDEMNMICILNHAIEEKRVVPVFQGIFNNKTGRIDKYEALMRIEGADGRLYSPAEFMDIAKKYHLYSKISTMMIEQVLTLFAGRQETVSINLSADDINFTATRQHIYNMLEKIGDAKNFVFELLEDESFRDMGLLRQFIQRVRKFGIRIAIDDFGRGYSNFLEIAKMEPDFIKMDGSIIREVVSNQLHQKVARNIVFLGDQLNAELVAEFVENGEIQEKVAELGVQYSQGYHHATPIRYEALGLMPRE